MNKFEKAKAQLEKSVKRHLVGQELDSSSEEEDLETDSIFDSVIKNYAQLGGKSDDLGRIQNICEAAFQSGAAVCLICIGSIKRTESIWSCESCFGAFHLLCVQRWAKDSIAHQKLAEEERPGPRKTEYFWHCPKCRKDYSSERIPYRYECFCGQTSDPTFHPWLVPHSCGQVCGKDLSPKCGHSCLLLCHPGPCPPCPKTVKSSCFCRRKDKVVRCSQKEWSCGGVCGIKLSCMKHTCASVCHDGPCPPCPKTSLMECDCGGETRLTPCAQLTWKCDKICGRELDCGKHRCDVVCHSGPCTTCPRSLPRSCPCGKETALLSCTEEVPTCGGTCDKLLECGLHSCSRRCHRGPCGACAEFEQKNCRCGAHAKEIQCAKLFLCENKCKSKRDCLVHLCNRKCCDGRCPPCEKPCGKTLRCGQHKCASVCHRGVCYPCQQTKRISCKCGSTSITVPCGTSRPRKSLKCNKLCKIPPDCHHLEREPHKCHQGPCPPCKQICGKGRPCGHSCGLPCHSSVLVLAIPDYKPATPWDVSTAPYEVKDLPCPDCPTPVEVWCPGKHELLQLPCHRAVSQPCGRPCGRTLPCSNHTCPMPCHPPGSPPCEPCADDCSAARLCSHPCPKSCHPPPCPDCQMILKLKCHCGINFVYIKCAVWLGMGEEEKMEKLSCSNQCPKNYQCGHRCSSPCHPGDCPDASKCRKKLKIFCQCKRLKKEVSCKNSQSVLPCDETCADLKITKLKKEEEAAREAEEKRNREELEKYERKFGAKRPRNKRKNLIEESSQSFWSKHKLYIFAGAGLIISLTGIFLVKYL